MLRNYFKLAIRNLFKHKTFSFINIFGLSVGLGCCMLISLYIYHEFTYDDYHENADRIFQLGSLMGAEGEMEARATVPAAMAGTLKQEFPEIKQTTRLLRLFEDDKTLLQFEEDQAAPKAFYETDGYIADPSFFDLFTFDFIEGTPSSALTEPNSVVVHEDIAKKFFGDQQALGKQIMIRSSTNGDHPYTITGVFRPQGQPSHLNGRFYMSVEGGNLEEFVNNSTTLLNNNMFYTYLLLKPGVTPKSLEAKFPAFVEKHLGEELRSRSSKRELFLTNLRDIHLESKISENVTAAGSRKYLWILGSIAILTLLIACINFMNLSTSRSSKRSVEVGVRKVLGAERPALMKQFLGESMMMALASFVLALIAVFLSLPFFERLAGKEILLTTPQQITLVLFFLVLAILTGLFAGSYPAFFLSSFKPVKVLKGRFSNSLGAINLRKGLVIVQFLVAVVLIVASVVISKQMTYLRSKDLGFKKDQQLVIPLRSSNAKEEYFNLKTALESSRHVTSAGGSTYYPGISNPTDWLMYKQGKDIKSAESVFINWVDESFLQTLDIQPVAGRIFSDKFPSDTSARMVLNQTGIEALGFTSAEEAVGNWVAFDWEGQQYRFDIVGVVKDFHFKDLHINIEPYGFLLNNSSGQNYLIAHLHTSDMGAALRAIEDQWKKFLPNEPFEYSFLDQDFLENYKAELRLADMINYFTLIAILISCLGLFGLAAFSAEQRIKEIGLRKVLGASTTNLVGLLSKDFLKLVLISVVLAIPIAWYIMNKWLQSFAYRIDIDWKIFGLTALLALSIALVTVSFQAIRAAMGNPVKNLRTE